MNTVVPLTKHYASLVGKLLTGTVLQRSGEPDTLGTFISHSFSQLNIQVLLDHPLLCAWH